MLSSTSSRRLRVDPLHTSRVSPSLLPLQAFGRRALCRAPPSSIPKLLYVDTATWQLDLAVYEQLAVQDAESMVIKNFQAVAVNWLAPDRLAIVYALQLTLPGQLSAAEVVEGLLHAERKVRRCAGYVAGHSAKRYINRLLSMQRAGVLNRFVRIKFGLKDSSSWISLRDVAKLRDDEFPSVVAAAAEYNRQHPAVQSQQPARGPLPSYQECMAYGEAWARDIAAQLPSDLLMAAAQAHTSGHHVKKAAPGRCGKVHRKLVFEYLVNLLIDSAPGSPAALPAWRSFPELVPHPRSALPACMA